MDIKTMQNHGAANELHARGMPEHALSSETSASPDCSPGSKLPSAPTSPPLPCQEDIDKWATHLVGRWWEIFWDPEPEITVSQHSPPSSCVNHQQQQQQQQQPIQANPSSHQFAQLDPAGKNQPPQIQHLGQQQRHPQKQQEYQQQQQQQQQHQQTRYYSIFCNTPSVGLSLSLSNKSQIIVTNVAPPTLNDPSNNYAMIRPRDVLVGVNGKTFHELVGIDTVMNHGRGPLHFVVDYLKTVDRPMSVMFERGEDCNTDATFPALATSTATVNPASAPAAATTMTTEVKINDSEKNDDNDCGDDDDDKEESDIDWYDAKVLSYNAKTRIFTVKFLGDDMDVTYEMALLPKLVRPSVRVWTRRALSLIHLDEKLMSVGGYADEEGGDGMVETTIECGLPPSTDLPEDSKQLGILSQMKNMEDGVSSERYRKLIEYSQLLEKQQYLSTRLSPLIHEDDEDDDNDNNVAEQVDHPGPLADSNYVEHLCNCMKEIKASCDWIICESAVLDILRQISTHEEVSTLVISRTDIIGETVASTSSSDVATKISKEVILQFLVNGSRFLNRLLSIDPDSKEGTSSQSARKGGVHRGRKKRRIGEAAVRSNHYATRSSGNFDSIYDTLLTRALLSNESLYSLVSQLLNNAALTNKCSRVWIIRSLTHSLSTLLGKLWTPVTNWISKSEDMITGASGQFYTIEDVESHVQNAEVKGTSIVLINLTEWTSKLVAKLNRARHFEVEILNAIGECIQPVVASDNAVSINDKCIDGIAEKDDCILTLRRLLDEAVCTTSSLMRVDRPMKNINPLGRSLVNYNSGMVLPSSLTRGVLNDAITVRRWVLDLSHANAVRERAGFVQNVITRYLALPQLPTLPILNSDGAFANPSAMLENNTRDIMTILSSNCYSYNHIIMNMSTRLQGSMNGDRDVLLRHKEEVLNSLATLQQLPVLSIVEEELHVRDELIDWNEDAKRVMTMSTQSKLTFNQIESLDRKLSDILSLRSDRRSKVNHRLREDRIVDKQIQSFAVMDQSVICPTTGSWVRDQHRRGCDWMNNYRSIIAALVDAATNTTRNKECVEVTRITALLEEHDKHLTVKFPEEYDQLFSAKQNVEQWTHSITDTILSDSITLEERCQRLVDAARLRPKGVLVDPAGDVVDLWVRVFTWRQRLKLGVEKMSDQFGQWVKNHPSGTKVSLLDDHELSVPMLSVFAPLIIEGQDLLISDEDVPRPFLKYLRSEAIQSLPNGGRSAFSKKTIVESSSFGKSVLNRALEFDSLLDSSLLFGRKMIWMMMLKGFFSGLESDTTFPGDMLDAKSLMLLGTGNFAPNSLLDTQEDEARLRTLIGIAETLNRRAFAILEKCTALLRSNCVARVEELRDALLELCDIQTDFNNSNPHAVKLLPDKALLQKLRSRISWVTWLLNAFTFDIFNENIPAQLFGGNRIHVNNLRDLHDKIPNEYIDRNNQSLDENLDIEIVRVGTLVKNLWDQADRWRSNVASLLPKLFGSASLDHERINDDVVNVSELISLTESPILTKVVMPELDTVQKFTEIAREVQSRLKKELFAEEYIGAIDVNQAHLPERKSLIASNGDFVLLRFTGSEMYDLLRQTLNSIDETATDMPLMTTEKATLKWMVRVFDWVGSINLVENILGQLVINADQAFEVLEQGHSIFYTVMDEVRTYLRGEHVGIEIFPHGLKVSTIADDLDSLGIGLLRWASFLFECLKSDVEKEDKWKDHSLGAIKSFLTFESESIGGTLTTFKNAMQFSDYVESLIAFASTLIIQDAEIIHSLSSLREKMKNNVFFQKSVEGERLELEERKFLLEKLRFTNPRNIVLDRYELLDSMMSRLSRIPYEDDEEVFRCIDDESFFDGEPSVRDKSRVFLEKSLWTGMETLGFDSKEMNARDCCSVLAWDLEDAVYMKYQKDNSDVVCNEYREKIRSLRFNLQDPKNPMLCAQVLAGDMTIQELVSASTEDLASIELKLKRRRVEEEALKNILLSADSEKKLLPQMGTSLKIENEGGDACTLPSPTTHHSSPSQKETSQILASIPPPPMRVKHKLLVTTLNSSPSQFDSPPSSPLLLTPQHKTNAGRSSKYILSQTGADLFQITISKLKRSFTAKLADDQLFEFDVNRFLPTDLVEKGRLSIDEFNKFINQKTKDGKWHVAHLKLAIGNDDSNMNCYKRFYKEYESLGRLAMIQVSDTTKAFLVTPKFLRVCKCLKRVENLSYSSTYAVILNKMSPPQEHIDVDDDMF